MFRDIREVLGRRREISAAPEGSATRRGSLLRSLEVGASLGISVPHRQLHVYASPRACKVGCCAEGDGPCWVRLASHDVQDRHCATTVPPCRAGESAVAAEDRGSMAARSQRDELGSFGRAARVRCCQSSAAINGHRYMSTVAQSGLGSGHKGQARKSRLGEASIAFARHHCRRAAVLRVPRVLRYAEGNLVQPDSRLTLARSPDTAGHETMSACVAA